MIRSYCRSYANTLERLLENESDTTHSAFLTLASLVLIDTVQLWQHQGASHSDQPRLVGGLVSPLHPLRLLWHLGHEALIREWIQRAVGRSTKALLPNPDFVTQQFDGG